MEAKSSIRAKMLAKAQQRAQSHSSERKQPDPTTQSDTNMRPSPLRRSISDVKADPQRSVGDLKIPDNVANKARLLKKAQKRAVESEAASQEMQIEQAGFQRPPKPRKQKSSQQRRKSMPESSQTMEKQPSSEFSIDVKSVPIDEVLEAPSVEVDIAPNEADKGEEPNTPKLGTQTSQEELAEKFPVESEQPADKPTEKPGEKPVEQPVEKPEEAVKMEINPNLHLEDENRRGSIDARISANSDDIWLSSPDKVASGEVTPTLSKSPSVSDLENSISRPGSPPRQIKSETMLQDDSPTEGFKVDSPDFKEIKPRPVSMPVSMSGSAQADTPAATSETAPPEKIELEALEKSQESTEAAPIAPEAQAEEVISEDVISDKQAEKGKRHGMKKKSLQQNKEKPQEGTITVTEELVLQETVSPGKASQRQKAKPVPKAAQKPKIAQTKTEEIKAKKPAVPKQSPKIAKSKTQAVKAEEDKQTPKITKSKTEVVKAEESPAPVQDEQTTKLAESKTGVVKVEESPASVQTEQEPKLEKSKTEVVEADESAAPEQTTPPPKIAKSKTEVVKADESAAPEQNTQPFASPLPDKVQPAEKPQPAPEKTPVETQQEAISKPDLNRQPFSCPPEVISEPQPAQELETLIISAPKVQTKVSSKAPKPKPEESKAEDAPKEPESKTEELKAEDSPKEPESKPEEIKAEDTPKEPETKPEELRTEETKPTGETTKIKETASEDKTTEQLPKECEVKDEVSKSEKESKPASTSEADEISVETVEVNIPGKTSTRASLAHKLASRSRDEAASRKSADSPDSFSNIEIKQALNPRSGRGSPGRLSPTKALSSKVMRTQSGYTMDSPATEFKQSDDLKRTKSDYEAAPAFLASLDSSASKSKLINNLTRRGGPDRSIPFTVGNVISVEQILSELDLPKSPKKEELESEEVYIQKLVKGEDVTTLSGRSRTPDSQRKYTGSSTVVMYQNIRTKQAGADGAEETPKRSPAVPRKAPLRANTPTKPNTAPSRPTKSPQRPQSSRQAPMAGMARASPTRQKTKSSPLKAVPDQSQVENTLTSSQRMRHVRNLLTPSSPEAAPKPETVQSAVRSMPGTPPRKSATNFIERNKAQISRPREISLKASEAKTSSAIKPRPQRALPSRPASACNSVTKTRSLAASSREQSPHAKRVSTPSGGTFEAKTRSTKTKTISASENWLQIELNKNRARLNNSISKFKRQKDKF